MRRAYNTCVHMCMHYFSTGFLHARRVRPRLLNVWRYIAFSRAVYSAGTHVQCLRGRSIAAVGDVVQQGEQDIEILM